MKQGSLSLQPPQATVEHAWTPDEIYDALDNDVTIIEDLKKTDVLSASRHASMLLNFLSTLQFSRTSLLTEASYSWG
jgi:hypothetical protein